MDFKTDLPLSSGYDTILVIVDRLTKRAWFLPTVATATAEQTAHVVFTWLLREGIGVPTSIVSDRDPLFTSDFWTSHFRLLGVEHKMSTADHPQTDGQSERTIRTLVELLRTMISHSMDNWVDLLPSITFQYNTAIHNSIGMSPIEADTGSKPRTPLVALAQVASGIDDKAALSIKQFAVIHANRLRQVQDSMMLSQQRQAQQANKSRRNEQFVVDDLVLVESDALRTNTAQASRPKSSLSLKFSGPFRVAAAHGNNAYRLDMPPSYGVHNTINISKLQRYVPNTFEERYDPNPGTEVVDGHEEHQVAAILAHKSKTGRPRADGRLNRVYLVHWQGEAAHQATWEPEANLIGEDGTITAALEKYLRLLPRTGGHEESVISTLHGTINVLNTSNTC